MFIYAGTTKNPKGYRFARAENFSFWTLSVLFKGATRVKSGGGSFVLEAGSLSLVESKIPYQIEALKSSHEIYAYFVPRPEMEGLLKWPMPLPGIRVVEFVGSDFSEKIIRAFEEMFELATSPLPNRSFFAENALERALLFAHLINPNQQYARLDERVIKAIKYIDGHLDGDVTVESLAHEVHLSPSRFGHLFREQIGKGALEYTEGRRLLEAQKLLVATNKSVSEIGELCGFKNQFHFSTRFKKFTGKPPLQYRRNPT
ncbi:MAG: helix-turn-helix domain-containing protein, partial [Chthoniobacterales bacterium]